MSQNVNQFGQSVEIGQLALEVTQNQSVITGVLNPDSTALAAALVPGIGLKLVDLAGDDPGPNSTPPIYDVRTDDSDPLDGVLLFNSKGPTEAGNRIEVASNGSVIYLGAQGALSRGADVALDVSEPGKIIAVGAVTKVGRLLDKATANGDIVRVKIDIVEA